jgi:hypothetical protein
MKKETGFIKSTLVVSCVFFLVACGGGGGVGGSTTAPPVVPSSTLSGTAAAGAAIIGQVTIKGSLGLTKSAQIETNGNYTVDVTGLTAPYRLRAVGTVGGRTYKLHSYAEAADLGGNVNITPFTDLIVANAASQIAESYFDSNTPMAIDPVNLQAQEDALQARLQAVFTALGVETAIDLLRSTFSADHSGLDAALDVVRIETDPGLNIATITNLIDMTTITDLITDATDNSALLVVSDPAALTTNVTDIQAIAAKFVALTAAFASGLPQPSEITDTFSTDFYDEDEPKGLFLTDITTDPTNVGISFDGISVSDLDTSAGTATVTFNVSINGITDLEPVTWLAAKDSTLGWQLRGNQRIVSSYFSFHCNDNNANGVDGDCGVNTRFEDNDVNNNGPMNAPIASGTVSIINGSDGTTIKDVIYLGVCDCTAPGDGQVWDEANAGYTGDYKGFGTSQGLIDSTIFTVGDIIQYAFYTQALDVITTAAPQIEEGAIAIATYSDTLLFAPSLVPLYPSATAASQTAITNFTLGSNLTVAWTLASGTRNSEVLVEIQDNAGNRLETWIETLGTTATSVNFASTALNSTATTDAGLDANATSYNLLVRVYAEDILTGQDHSRDYNATIPGPGATTTPPSTTNLACNYESGWNDAADGGLGAPITPKSFADYEGTLESCGTAMSFTAADVAGKTFVDGVESSVFNALGGATGTESSQGTGSFVDTEDTIAFNWYVEAATCTGCTHSYLVQYSDSTIDNSLDAGFSFRETTSLTGLNGPLGVSNTGYTYHKYSEQSNYGDGVRAVGSDGEIWFSTDILQ